MSEKKEKVFADGFLFKRNEKAPDFVVGGLSIKVEEAIPFITEHQKNGWVNLDVKKSKKGTYYLELDTWESKEKTDGGNTPTEAPEDILF
tara:strand:- start:4891 stop:5160 length:270 start_codon:yes stop_codon:yes gene_type:complete